MKSFTYNRHVFFVCLISMLGFGIFSFANTGAKFLSTSSWITPLACAALFSFPAVILSILSVRYENCTIFEYAPICAGKTGKVLSIIFSLFYLIFSALMLSYYSHIISMWILPDTNFRLLLAFIIIICFYALSVGFSNVARVVAMLGFISVLVVIFIRIVMIFSGDLTNLLPAIDTETIKKGFSSSFFQTMPFFFGIGALSVIPRPSSSKSPLPGALFSIVSVAVLMILISSACMAIIGPLQTGLYEDAMVVAMKAFDVSYITFIQRADIIFIITWSLLILSSACCIIYIPYSHVKAVFAKKNPVFVRLGMCAVIFLSALIPSDITHALNLISLFCIRAGVFALFIIPSVLLIFSEVRRHEKK